MGKLIGRKFSVRHYFSVAPTCAIPDKRAQHHLRQAGCRM
jgi:hypothetical protein